LQQGSDELAQEAPSPWASRAAQGQIPAPAGRVLEFVDKRLEQKDDQEVGQQLRVPQMIQNLPSGKASNLSQFIC